MNTITIIFVACLAVALGEPPKPYPIPSYWLKNCLEFQNSTEVLTKPSKNWTERDIACHRTCEYIYKGIINVSGTMNDQKLTKEDGFLEDIRSFLWCKNGRTNCDLVECMMFTNNRH